MSRTRNPLTSCLTAALRAQADAAPTDGSGIPAQQETLPQDLHRISEACRLLGLSRCTAYRWFRRGWVTFYGHRGAYYTSLKELLPAVKRLPTRPSGTTPERENRVPAAPRQRAGSEAPPQKS